ncbi:MAG: hypothetical protein ATN35_06005 [Epulopiscium sp. Nele67-Bin004]|nr:MAG: hypothetical protein ATN35_06005 [Epulopiscium sp. Nele67-Bin004]
MQGVWKAIPHITKVTCLLAYFMKFKKIKNFMIIGHMLGIMATNIYANSNTDIVYNYTAEDIQQIYTIDSIEEIRYIPDDLLEKYYDTILLADSYLLALYGQDTMLSTDEFFQLDIYYQNIKMGLCLDLTDFDIIEQLHKFVDEIILLYLNTDDTNAGRNQIMPTIESDVSYQIVAPIMNASSYNVNKAVEYARKWMQEGKTLFNPDYTRYTFDCTNFIDF